MRGGHDLGGRQGFGPVDPEPESEEPVFHEEWERRVFALTMATGMLGQWNIDQSRHARERQHPVAYLEQSYYENWLAGTEKLLLEAGLVSAEELRSGTAKAECGKNLRIPDAKAARKILTSGGPAARQIESPPRFAVGNEVIVERKHATGHTRSPDYVQGLPGPGARSPWRSHLSGRQQRRGNRWAHHLYSVEFSSRELWGCDAEPFDVLIDLWEPYLALVNVDGE